MGDQAKQPGRSPRRPPAARRSSWARAAAGCVSLGLLAQLTGGCGSGPVSEPSLDELRQALSPDERLVRAAQIREAAAARGLYNGILLAGIADTETGMSHCHSELTWACEGPNSPDCGGGPVVAGAGDGPCSLKQGGLGMFQFDAGTYDQTLAREGDRILTVAGNTDAAVDFVINMVKRSVYAQADTDAEALDWMNRVRPWNELWMPWVQTVTRYYNGCVPGTCSVYDQRYANYSRGGTGLLAEMGVDFWYGREPACEPIGAEPTILDETGWCFAAGGDPQYWRNETSGYQDHLLWTSTTSDLEAANFAKWYLYFDQPGRYEIEVFTAQSFAQATRADYHVRGDSWQASRTFDQTAADGWQSLGEFDFLAQGSLEVGDNAPLGSVYAEKQQLVADAVRVSLREVAGGTGGVAGYYGCGGSCGGSDYDTGGGGAGTGVSPVTRTEPGDGGCACRVSTEPVNSAGSLPWGNALGFACGLGLLALRRRRS